ncbi:uncharacterized protein [Rhodnius prolixus]|uniref:uncharacterized protein n=1 Tax=Rhodnius prolixus TaxID=13249 RepID=UPI003D18CE5E
MVSCHVGSTSEFYIVPTYLNCSHWEEHFNGLTEFISEFAEADIIVVGDINARTGTLQEISSELPIDSEKYDYVRRSKDDVVNTRGGKFVNLCDEYGLIILNGRSKSDAEGHFTYVGARGSSVIDLCCVSLNVLPMIDDFSVECETFSDHLPISFSIKLLNVDEQVSPLLPQIRWVDNNKTLYQKRLVKEVQQFSDLEQCDPENAISLLVESVRRATFWHNSFDNKMQVFKQPWYDWNCYKARKKSRKLLKLYRRSSSQLVKKAYFEANNNYKQLIVVKKSEYYKNLLEKFKSVKLSKDFWDVVKAFKKPRHFIDSGISSIDWVHHFKSLLCPPRTKCALHCYAPPLNISPQLDGAFSMDELYADLGKAKNNKAPGVDRLSYEFFKNAPSEYLERLLLVFNEIYVTGSVPSSFKESIIFPLFKKGSISEAKNYRGLSFLNCIGKLFCGLLLNRLELFVNSNQILKECQAGFRKGYSTVDCIFVLFNLVRIQLHRKGRKLYAFFVDLKAAFDTVDRDALYLKLFNCGISSRFITALKNMYRGSVSSVWTPQGRTETFSVNTGVRQGCLLSPLLFALFINDLEDEFESGVQVGSQSASPTEKHTEAGAVLRKVEPSSEH